MTPPKEKFILVVDVPLSTQQRLICDLQKIENRFDEGYDSDK